MQRKLWGANAGFNIRLPGLGVGDAFCAGVDFTNMLPGGTISARRTWCESSKCLRFPQVSNRWWTKSSEGTPKEGAEYKLGFGPGYDWRAKVTRCDPAKAFEFTMTDVHEDWQGTRVGCELDAPQRLNSGSLLPHPNDHWRVSGFSQPELP